MRGGRQKMSTGACQLGGHPAAEAATMCEYVVDRWERKKWSSLSIMESDGTGVSKVEGSSSQLWVVSPITWGDGEVPS